MVGERKRRRNMSHKKERPHGFGGVKKIINQGTETIMDTSKAIVKRNNLDYTPPNVGVLPLSASRPNDSPSRLEKIRAPIGAVPAKPEVNLEEACRFVEMFGKGSHAWQTFDDNKTRKSPDLVSKDWYGTFEAFQNRLVQKNAGGAIVAVCINKCKNGKRIKANITEIRAIYVDTDGVPLQPILDAGPKPHIIVESSPGKYHVYWMVDDCPVERFEAIMLALANKFGCDKQVCNLNTVMRLPGFLHQKGEPFLTRILELNPQLPKYKTDDLISKFGLHIEEPKAQAAPRTNPTSDEIITCLYNNEDGDRDLLIQLLQEKFRYDHAEDDWFTWAGHSWKLDEIGEVLEAVSEVTETYYAEAKRQTSLRIQANKEDREEKEKEHKKIEDDLFKRAGKLQSLYRKKNVIYLSARGLNSLGIPGSEWDQNRMLLPVLNGVVDLHDGRLRPGHQSDYIKTVAPVEWLGIDTPAPIWEKFMADIIIDDELNPDPNTVQYLQRLLGYAASGSSVEHIFPILWGDKGRNGKGTLLQTLSYVLGPLAGKISSEILLQSKQSSSAGAATPHLMAFRGKRLCFASETDQNRRLNVNLIKELAGGDIISARSLYAKRYIDFPPTHTLFLMTNNKPIIPVRTTDPIWDRIHIIPFHRKFVDVGPVKENFESQKDIYLPEKLKAEAPGILAWLVRGCLAWQKGGLSKSTVVKMATEAYQKEEDVLGQFIADKCVIGDGFKVAPGKIFEAYRSWCEERNTRATNQTDFGRDLGHRFSSQGKQRHKKYLGIQLEEQSIQGN